MKNYKITFIEGDGIGRDVSNAAKKCVDAVAEKYNFTVQWDRQYAGAGALKEFGNALPEKTLSSIKRNKAALKGPITTPIGSGFRSVNVEIRQRLGLFANVRPAKSIKGAKSKYRDIDIVVVRENSEDLYGGLEFIEGSHSAHSLIQFVKSRLGKKIRNDSAIALKVISKEASCRIFDFAFNYALENKRKRVTAVHKANILKYTDGLFIGIGEHVAGKFRKIKFDEKIVDEMCAQLVVKPETFDIIVCPNLYGDILSDLCAGLVGGLGLVPSANIGGEIAVFEPVHGSAPRHAGKNDVNPTAAILSSAMMLQHIGEHKAAKTLESSVLNVIKRGRCVTYDLNPDKPSTTTEMTDAIISEVG